MFIYIFQGIVMLSILMTVKEPEGELLGTFSIKSLGIRQLMKMKAVDYIKVVVELIVLGALLVIAYKLPMLQVIGVTIGIFLFGVLIDYSYSRKRGISLHKSGIKYFNKVYDWNQVAGAVVEDNHLAIMVLGRLDLLNINEVPSVVADAINECIQHHMKINSN